MLISCPRGHRKVHDSRGYWFQNVGIDLFSWNKEIFAIYSHSTNTRTILFPQKQRPSTLKKDQWTVIVLSFLGRVSFPVLHQLWQLSQWWRRQDLCICIVSVRVAKFSLLATLSSSPSHILSVFMGFFPTSPCPQYWTLLFFNPKLPFLHKTETTPCFWELKTKTVWATKESIDVLNMFSNEDKGTFGSVPHVALVFHAVETTDKSVFAAAPHLQLPGFPACILSHLCQVCCVITAVLTFLS